MAPFTLAPGDRVEWLPPMIEPQTQALIDSLQHLMAEVRQRYHGRAPYDDPVYQSLLRNLSALHACCPAPRLLVTRAPTPERSVA